MYLCGYTGIKWNLPAQRSQLRKLRTGLRDRGGGKAVGAQLVGTAEDTAVRDARRLRNSGWGASVA